MSVAVREQNDEEESGGLLVHLPAIIRQRLWWLIIPAILCLIAGIAAAFLMPTVYRSTATLLVESPQLPEDISGEQTTDIVDQRIAKIRQQVLSRPDLIELIQKHGLYIEERGSESLSTVIQDMRDSTAISPVMAELQQNANGQSSTIAFSLSFDYPAAAKAQAVAQDITEQILLIDATKNAEQATNTVQFLTDQAGELQAQIATMEAQLAGIKARNGQVLSSAGMTMLGMSGGNYDAQIISLQRENAMLNSQRDLTKTAADRDPLVANAEAQLAAARAAYSDTHPDVAIARRRLVEAKALASTNQQRIPVDTIAQQISSNNAQIAAMQAAKGQENARVSATIGAQSRAPLVMEQVAQIQQKLDGLNGQYTGVAARLLTAQANEKAENEQRGERLSVIDPPVTPEDPESPNRPLLIAGGLAFGLSLGLVLILALELFHRPIRDPADIKTMLGEMPLVMIPNVSVKSAKRPWYAKLSPLQMVRDMRRKKKDA